MIYIILDMEWDNAFFPPEKKFINQIIQIGAVKLNDAFDVTDTFEVTVRSEITNRVTGRFSKLTGITTEMMRAGIPLKDAVLKYNEWIGENTVTMTWSKSDLYSIMANEKYLLSGIRFKIDKYLDLQSYIQNEMRICGTEIKSQIALSAAAELSGISTELLSLHTAKDDSLLCAELLKKYYNKSRFNALVKDTADEEFYKRLNFKSHYIDDLSSCEIDRSAFKFRCDKCGKKARRKTKWSFKNRYFTADFYCRECGEMFSARVSFKKTYDDVIVKKRICPKGEEHGKDEVQFVPKKV